MQPLNIKEWQDIIDAFLELGARRFHISGKEPLTSRMTFDIIQYLTKKSREYDLSYGMITNGILVKKWINELVDAKLSYLDFSIDGEELENDFLRGNGAYKKALNSLEMVHSMAVANDLWVSSVAHKNNYESIVKMISNLSHRVGIRNFFIQPLQVHGNARNLESMQLTLTDYLRFLGLIIDAIEKETINIKSNIVIYLPQHYISGLLEGSEIVRNALFQYFEAYSSEYKIGKSTISFRFHITCIAYWRTIQITPDGYYMGCSMPLSSPRYWEYAVGNVRLNSVEYLYKKSLGSDSTLALAYNEHLTACCKDKPCFKICFSGCRIFTHIRSEHWDLPHPSCQNQSFMKES